MDGTCFSVPPPAVPTIVGPTALSFGFTPTALAEHQEIVFTLGISVASTGKTYPSQTFTVRCDSPPDPVGNLTTGYDTVTNQTFIAFGLPTAVTDDDLSSLIVTYQDVTNPGSPATVTLGVSNPALLAAGSPDLLSSISSPLKRYFRPSVTPGDAYAFQVAIVDAIGQKSSTETVGASGIQYTLSYNPNGGTGPVPAPTSYNYNTAATLDSGAGLTLAGWVFTGWNTAADGSGTAYAGGDSLPMTLGNLVLYARWEQLGTVSVSASWGSFQTLGLSPATVTLSLSGVHTVLVTPSFTNGTNWKWSVDGVQDLGQTSSSFSFSATTLGFDTVSVTVTNLTDGYTYSASLAVTVTE